MSDQHAPVVFTLTLAELEIVNGWYWHTVDAGHEDDEDTELYGRMFAVIDAAEAGEDAALMGDES